MCIDHMLSCIRSCFKSSLYNFDHVCCNYVHIRCLKYIYSKAKNNECTKKRGKKAQNYDLILPYQNI
jgi:hypothetical protein